MYEYIQKTLDWGVKFASLAVTAPATWIVATELFSDVTIPALFFLMRFAAVFLIEGVLLSNWLLLEFDKKATPEIKARYGLTALAMYTALLVIAWKHEGPTGLVFRVALLAALIGSGWDTYVYTWQRTVSRVDRSASNSRRVKRHARRLSIKEAVIRRESEHRSELALIKAQGDATLEQMGLYRGRLIAGVRLEDKAERLKLAEVEHSLDASSDGRNVKKKLPPSPLPLLEQPGPTTSIYIGDKNYESQRQRLSILDALADDPNYTRQNLADKLGISQRATTKVIKELLDDGLIYKEGGAHYLTELGDVYVQNKRIKAPADNGRG